MSFTWFRPEGPLKSREQIAREVHEVSLSKGLDELASVIALMAISTEVGTGVGELRRWWCPANPAVPATLTYPYDSKSDDSRSSGYLQQQPGPNGEPWWGTTENMMTLTQSVGTFLDRLPDDYTTAAGSAIRAGLYAQQVQQSSFPDRYAEKWAEAWDVLGRAIGGTLTDRPEFNEYANWTANNQDRGGTTVDLFLLHTQEGGGGDNAADDLGRYIRSTETMTSDKKVSYHYTISQASDGGVTVVDCVDTDLASWSVGNANNRSINLCFAGSKAAWTREQWLTQSKAIDVAAYLAVQDCKKYGIPTTVIGTGGKYGTAKAGIADHNYVTKVIGWGSHTDVGVNFPVDVFTTAVNKYASGLEPEVPVVVQRLPQDLTDRQLLEDIWVQLRGVGGKGWPQLGQNDKGQNLTLIDAIAELRKS